MMMMMMMMMVFGNKKTQPAPGGLYAMKSLQRQGQGVSTSETRAQQQQQQQQPTRRARLDLVLSLAQGPGGRRDSDRTGRRQSLLHAGGGEGGQRGRDAAVGLPAAPPSASRHQSSRPRCVAECRMARCGARPPATQSVPPRSDLLTCKLLETALAGTPSLARCRTPWPRRLIT